MNDEVNIFKKWIQSSVVVCKGRSRNWPASVGTSGASESDSECEAPSQTETGLLGPPTWSSYIYWASLKQVLCWVLWSSNANLVAFSLQIKHALSNPVLN